MQGQVSPADSVIGHVILGILMPEGWAILDSVTYKAVPSSNYIQKGGTFIYNDAVVSFLNSNVELPPAGFYWWGGKTSRRINRAYVESGFIYIFMGTNDKMGEFEISYILGDDSEWNLIDPNQQYGIVADTTLAIKVDFESNSEFELELEDWEIYPNPSNGIINVSLASFTDDVVMKVLDLNGRIQKTEILKESLIQVNLSNLSKGCYMLSLEKKGEIKTKRVIIK